MVEQNPVEQRLVAVLQRPQVDVFVEIVAARGEFVPAVLGLLLEGLDRRRQQTHQAQSPSLVLGEGGALGGQGIEQPGRPRSSSGIVNVPSVRISREGNEGVSEPSSMIPGCLSARNPAPKPSKCQCAAKTTWAWARRMP